MRKALALAAFLAMAPYAQAQDAGNASFNAEYRVRGQYDNFITGRDTSPTSQDHIQQRFKLGGTFKANDRLSASFTLLHNTLWGSNNFGYGAAGTDDSGRGRLDGIGDSSNMILVQEAYGTWMVTDELTLRFGRGSFTMGDGTVIHANDWDPVPVTFEGVLGSYEMEVGRLSLFGVRFAEYFADGAAVTPTSQDAEANSYGLSYAHKALPEFLKMADVHVNKINKAQTGQTGSSIDFGQDITRYGVSLAGDVAMIDWRAVYNAHTGKYITGPAATKVDAKGEMYEGEIGFNFEEFMKSRAYVLYHRDSKDYDAYFYYRHGNAGLMDVFLWGNLTDLAVGWTFEPMDATTVGIQYHKFERTDVSAGVRAGMYGADVLAFGGDSKDLGQEIDLEATHTYDNGLMVTGRLGMFSPGKALKDGYGAGVDSKTYGTAFIEAKMNF